MTVHIQEVGSKEKALLGKKKGDTFELRNGAGESVSYMILDVI